MSETIIERTLRYLAYNRQTFRDRFANAPRRDDIFGQAEAEYLGACRLAKAQRVISEDAYFDFRDAIYTDTLSPLLLDLYEQYDINPDEPHA